jgi:hypothetical protein
VASVGAIDGTATTWPRRAMPERPTTSPTIAVAIGIPIATTDPNARTRITIAAISPTASLRSVLGSESSLPIGPPAATSRPADRAGSAASDTLSAISSVSSLEPTSRRTGTKAVVPSFETCA